MDPKKIVKKGYDKVGEKYTATRNEDLVEKKFLPEFAEYVPSGGKILDIGCGGGVPFTKYLSEKYKVTGIDISPNQITLARKNVPNSRFICMDMGNLDFEKDYFHGILAYYSIIHLPRDEHADLFKKMYRILKLGGIVLMTLTRNDDAVFIDDDFFGATMYWSGFDQVTNIDLVKKAGFEIVWEKLVPDSLGDNLALFVLARKPI